MSTRANILISGNNGKLMKIQYLSDLHLEFPENSQYIQNHPIPVTGDILILAGDTMYLNDSNAPKLKFWQWASDNYREVLLIPGNHEYYHFCNVLERGLYWQWKFLQNVGYYQNQVVHIDDTDIILSTLWSHITPQDEYFVWRGLNDFPQTRINGHMLCPEDYNDLHSHCLNFIKKSVAESNAKHIVVVTHHLPTLQVVAPQHKGSVLNSAFATELGDFIASSRIGTWIYGHSHTNIDTEINSTRILCNQLGYTFNSEHLHNGFDPSKFIEV